MNFVIPWWAKALVLLALIGGAFSAGMVTEARWEVTGARTALLEQQKQAQEQQAKLASDLTQKMREMTDAAVKSAQERSDRERQLETERDDAIAEAEKALTNPSAIGLPAAAATALDRLRKHQPAAAQH